MRHINAFDDQTQFTKFERIYIFLFKDEVSEDMKKYINSIGIYLNFFDRTSKNYKFDGEQSIVYVPPHFTIAWTSIDTIHYKPLFQKIVDEFREWSMSFNFENDHLQNSSTEIIYVTFSK